MAIHHGAQLLRLSSQESPCPIAPPARHLADGEFGDEAERGALVSLGS